MSGDRQDEPLILERSQHSISRQNIDDSAVKVLYRLHNAGYKGYLVGGGVRDLLLGRQPKDFDVATDAKPGELRRLFRNSRIIGRRFRLAHVFFKDQIVEVATFRRDPDPDSQDGPPEDLLITDDNVFGSPREDAFRRDFTVNALFYDIGDFSVIDYVGGTADLDAKMIRVIGDPDVRFREDPVRMMRACELAGRLGFTIEAATAAAITRQRTEIHRASPARLTEEILELLRCGAAASAFGSMRELGLLRELLPEAQAVLDAESEGVGELARVLPLLDRLVAGRREVRDGALLGALLLPVVLLRRRQVEASRRAPLSRSGLRRLIDEVCAGFFGRLTIAKARAEEVSEALSAFHRLGETRWDAAEQARFTRRASFADAVVLFELLVEATGEGAELLGHWRALAEAAGGSGPRPRARRRGRRRSRGPKRRR
ncbi:MAG: polynucleotide adenylyltransferase PcnB [Thermoanaerobaculia bacterium]